jgi:hypothetical protein
MAPLLLRALVALLCALAAAAQVPLPCAGVEEKCSGSFSLPCCPNKFLECSAGGRCLYVRAAAGGAAPPKKAQG